MSDKVLLPIKGAYITQKFDVMTATGGDHIHGALDLSGKIGTEILAPEDGFIYGFVNIRYKDGQYWENIPNVRGIRDNFAFCNYFYDMFGGVTVLESKDGRRTHLFCHSYGNQIFNQSFYDTNKVFVEEKKNSRFPIFGIYTEKIEVTKGDIIGRVGQAGYNMGTHLHWEIHSGINNWQTYDQRIDPETLLYKKDIKYRT